MESEPPTDINQQRIHDLWITAIDVPPVSRSRIAAAVYKRGQLISIGMNQAKTHPFQRRFAKDRHCNYWHAETSAIYNALKKMSTDDLAHCDMYIARAKMDTHKRWEYGLAKPCPGCYGAIDFYKINNVYYTNDENDYELLK